MPEGDTVLVAAGRLDNAMAGETLTRTEFRVPRFAAVDMAGQVVTSVVARGKHILLRTDAAYTVHSHFKMEGSWHLYRPGVRWRGPSFQVRAILTTEPWLAVGFRLGQLNVIKTQDEHRLVAHLGPDVLGPDWDRDEALRRLRARPAVAIGTALIDQRNLAGPGNIYKSEVCFLARLHPWTSVEAVPDLVAVVDLTKKLMEANRSSGRQVTTGDPRPSFARWVAGRAGRPCRRCGTTIRAAEQESYDSSRITYWCPTCQPEASS